MINGKGTGFERNVHFRFLEGTNYILRKPRSKEDDQGTLREPFGKGSVTVTVLCMMLFFVV